MKTIRSLAICTCVAAVASITLQGCGQFQLERASAPGTISLAIEGVDQDLYSDGTFLKSGVGADTNNYILSIYSTEGDKVYEGKYGTRPEEITVTAGSYDVGIYSMRFNPPMFDAPQFGDRQTIVVAEGEQAKVSFMCRQLNAGLRLKFSNDFIAKFPGNGVYVLQGENRAAYDYSQTKYIFVDPSNFNIAYNRNNKDTVLLSKIFQSGQMVTMTLSYDESHTSASFFSVQVDTTRDWVNFRYNVGLKIPVGTLTIAEAKEMVGEKVKVFGYILGGDPTTNSVRVGPPFESKSSIVIAVSMEERNRDNMMVVELPSGAVRDGINLVNNPHLLGSPVVVTGTVAQAYYGYPGIKNTKSYVLL